MPGKKYGGNAKKDIAGRLSLETVSTEAAAHTVPETEKSNIFEELQKCGSFFSFLFLKKYILKVNLKFTKKGEKLHMDILQTRRNLDVSRKETSGTDPLP